MMRATLLMLHSLPFEPMALTTAETLQTRLQALRPFCAADGTPRLSSLVTGATMQSAASSRVSTTGSTAMCSTRLTAPLARPGAPRALYKGSSQMLSPSSATTTTTTTMSGSRTLPTQELHWFDSNTRAPFFISPKHDGIRLISYVKNHHHNKNNNCIDNNNVTFQSSRATKDAPSVSWTCYSRYGRPIDGVFWIESELRLLRALCGDARLVLDGELYLHSCSARVQPNVSKLCEGTKQGAFLQPCKRAVASATKGGFLTGFLAVSSLVKRLRGSCSNCATVSDILQYVPTLPRYCVFDIPSYSPPVFGHPMQSGTKRQCMRTDDTSHCELQQQQSRRGRVQKSKRKQDKKSSNTPDKSKQPHHHRHDQNRSISEEIMRVWSSTMHECHISCVEELRIVPNVTPFSSRLRTMHFLFALLERGEESVLLREHFELVPHADTDGRDGMSQTTTAKVAGEATRKSRKTSKNSNAPSCGGSASRTDGQRKYKGGVFTGLVPYSLARSLPEANEVLLPRFLASGYEGAVVRSPMNAYEMREKVKHTIRGLVQPLLDYPTVADEHAAAADAAASSYPSPSYHSYSTAAVGSRRSSNHPSDSLAHPFSARSMTGVHRICGAVAAALRASQAMAHTHVAGGSTQVNGGTTASYRVFTNHHHSSPAASATTSSALPHSIVTSQEGICHDNIDLAQLAMSRARLLSPRSASAVKLLPFSDQEYAILRPLFKEPSVNPRTRPLLSIAKSQLSPGQSILRSSSSSSAASSSERASTSLSGGEGVDSMSDSVTFYGLECLASNGRVFHVTLPKMSFDTQQELLNHLMHESRRTEGGRNGRQVLGSLTGLYVTIKFPSLTEHGVPRFGTVKAIRGGKGWFL